MQERSWSLQAATHNSLCIRKRYTSSNTVLAYYVYYTFVLHCNTCTCLGRILIQLHAARNRRGVVCAIIYPFCIKVLVTCSVNQLQRCFCCNTDHNRTTKLFHCAPSIFFKDCCLFCMSATSTWLPEQGGNEVLCCRFEHGHHPRCSQQPSAGPTIPFSQHIT